MADRPLSERLADLSRLPDFRSSVDTLTEAFILAVRFEHAPVATVPKPPPGIECSGITFDVPIRFAGKRVALVEVPDEH